MPPTDAGATPAWRELQRGDLVEIEGRTERGGFAPNVAPQIIRRLGQAPLPRPKTIAFGSMLSGRHDCDYVEITGVVQRAWRSSDPQIRTLFIDVAVEEGVVRAAFWDYQHRGLRAVHRRPRPAARQRRLAVRTHRAAPRRVALRRPHRRHRRARAAARPVTLPTRPIRSIYNYSATGEVNRRIRIRGVVTSYIPGRPVEISDFTSTAMFRYVRNVLYVDDGTGGARIETEQPQRVEPGTVVDVAGFPAVTPGKPILTNAVFKVAGMAPQPAAVAVERRQRPERRQRRDAGADAGAFPQRADGRPAERDRSCSSRRQRVRARRSRRRPPRSHSNSFVPGRSWRSPASTHTSRALRRRSGCFCGRRGDVKSSRRRRGGRSGTRA